MMEGAMQASTRRLHLLAVSAFCRSAGYHCPKGVRRYSYRKDAEIPFGQSPARDNVRLAFNALPPHQDSWVYPSSVSSSSGSGFHPSWNGGWACETEFGWER